MGKSKLQKFADMETYPHVFQYPYSTIENVPFAMQGQWNKKFFNNNYPIVLELGCGKGEYTIGLARLFPKKNFIGIDIKGARMWTGATDSIKEKMKNIAFLRTNIEIIDRFFAPNEIDEVWLTFPDPQMKQRTKRLTSVPFLNRYRYFLKDKGIIHLKTDSSFLYSYTKALVDINHLPLEYATNDLYKNNKIDSVLNIKTYYEQQWLQRGIAIKYIKFCLPHEEQTLVEPDIEIPLDSYRSYDRNKRSSLIRSK